MDTSATGGEVPGCWGKAYLRKLLWQTGGFYLEYRVGGPSLAGHTLSQVNSQTGGWLRSVQFFAVLLNLHHKLLLPVSFHYQTLECMPSCKLCSPLRGMSATLEM
jgi:hypothetical protein